MQKLNFPTWFRDLLDGDTRLLVCGVDFLRDDAAQLCQSLSQFAVLHATVAKIVSYGDDLLVRLHAASISSPVDCNISAAKPSSLFVSQFQIAPAAAINNSSQPLTTGVTGESGSGFVSGSDSSLSPLLDADMFARKNGTRFYYDWSSLRVNEPLQLKRGRHYSYDGQLRHTTYNYSSRKGIRVSLLFNKAGAKLTLVDDKQQQHGGAIVLPQHPNEAAASRQRPRRPVKRKLYDYDGGKSVYQDSRWSVADVTIRSVVDDGRRWIADLSSSSSKFVRRKPAELIDGRIYDIMVGKNRSAIQSALSTACRRAGFSLRTRRFGFILRVIAIANSPLGFGFFDGDGSFCFSTSTSGYRNAGFFKYQQQKATRASQLKQDSTVVCGAEPRLDNVVTS